MVCCMLLVKKLDLNISDIIIEKNNKNREKYTVEKIKGKAIKYTKFENE